MGEGNRKSKQLRAPAIFAAYMLLVVAGWALSSWAWLVYGPGIVEHFWAAGTAADEDFPARMGQFGDTFGVVNSLFSGLGLVGIMLLVYQISKDSREAEEDRKDNLEKHQAILTSVTALVEKMGESAASARTLNRLQVLSTKIEAKSAEVREATDLLDEARRSGNTGRISYYTEMRGKLYQERQKLFEEADKLSVQ